MTNKVQNKETLVRPEPDSTPLGELKRRPVDRVWAPPMRPPQNDVRQFLPSDVVDPECQVASPAQFNGEKTFQVCE